MTPNLEFPINHNLMRSYRAKVVNSALRFRCVLQTGKYALEKDTRFWKHIVKKSTALNSSSFKKFKKPSTINTQMVVM